MAYTKRRYLRLYLDVWPATLMRMDDSQAGQIFRAMMEYAAGGALPEFTDESLAAVWNFIKPSVDRDLAVCEAKQCRAEARYSAPRKAKRSDDA